MFKNFWSQRRAHILLIFLLALTLRFIHIYQMGFNNPAFDITIKGQDMKTFIDWAVSICKGDYLGRERGCFYHGPVYPYTLAIIFKVFGPGLVAAKYIQAVIGSLSCVLLYLIGEHLFNRKVGLVSAIFASLYGLFIFYEGVLLRATPVIFVYLLMFFCLCRVLKRPSKRGWFITGLALGLAALTRENILLFSPFVLVSIWVYPVQGANRKRLLFSALLIAGLCIVIFPVTLRNYLIGGKLALISSGNAPSTFYLGNCYDSTGTFDYPPSFSKVSDDAKREGRKLNMLFETFKSMKRYPLLSLKLQLKKQRMFWSSFERPNNVNYYFQRRFSSLLRLPLFNFGIIAPLALFGMGLLLRQWRRLSPLYFITLTYTASVTLFFVIARYRLPVVPFLILFAGYTVCWLWEKIFAHRWRDVLVSVVLLVCIGFLVYERPSSYIRSSDYFALGLAYDKKSRYEEASHSYRQAIKMNPLLEKGDRG